MNPLNFPKLTKHVTDFSGALTSSQCQIFSEKFAQHERNTTEEVVVVLFPHRQGNELRDIGLKLFNENKIGQKKLNNGILLIIATEERKIRIVTGKGMEIKYSEMRCRDIIENHLRTLVDRESYVTLIDTWQQIISGDISTSNHSDTGINSLVNGVSRENYGRGGILTSGVLGIFSIFMIHGYISGTIGLLLGVGISILLYKLYQKGTLKKNILFLILVGPLVLIFISILAFFTPAVCTQVDSRSDGAEIYHCERDVFGHAYNYTYTLGGSSSSSSSSHNYGGSSSSSFGGGGGSSNGGGYGD